MGSAGGGEFCKWESAGGGEVLEVRRVRLKGNSVSDLFIESRIDL